MSRLVCQSTKATYSLNDPRWRSESGGLLDIEYDFTFDLLAIQKRAPTLWRYREAIPIERDENIVSFNEGFTPLVPVDIDGREIHLKLDYLFPTASFKDRGATVLISKVKELGIDRVLIDSSGNAGCAVSAYCARAGIACDVYVPAHASPAKIAQMKLFGARVHCIPGSRDETAKAALEAAETVYNAAHSWNPFFSQGTKTLAYEIWEQMEYTAPDAVLVPTGNGTLLIGLHIGFQDLRKQNLIDTAPRLIAVQAANCAPLYPMFHEGLTEPPTIETLEVVAEGIAIPTPPRAHQLLEAIRETDGTVLVVTDEEVTQSMRDLCAKGLHAEPTSAATVAALRHYTAKDNERIVVPLTGHGLKSKFGLTVD